MRIVLATRNEDKVREISEILASVPVTLSGLAEFPDVPDTVEDGATFLENARKKAMEVWRRTGIAALADDSGLEVEALRDRPGIMSRRFAGPDASYADNNAKLLRCMAGIPWEARGARFVCVAALVTAGGEARFTEGDLRGFIAESPSGEGGFGYDPLFYLPEYGKTVAELEPAVKNSISHRAKAMGAMRRVIERLARGDS